MGIANAKLWRIFLGGVVCAMAVSRVAGQNSRASPSSSKQSTSTYVDPAVCARCHRDIAASYRLTGMGRSFTLPSPSNAIEDYKQRNTVYHQPSGLYYTMVERNGVFYQRRHEVGFDGKETNIVEELVDYVIGSGNHARSYLHRAPDGKLFELPVTWYSEESGYWAMSPGFDHPNQPDFRRAVDGECLSCHDGFPRGEKFPDRRNVGEAFFPKDIPTGIDCQRCHGPGSSHVQAALSGKATIEEIRHAIVNPARLSRDRQLEVCMQCHLETDSIEKPNEVRRYGRDLDAYRPGNPLGDFKIYFDQASEAGRDDKFQIAHQVYRLRMSACFRQSRMTCLTCHDPHRPYRSADSTQRYVAICMNCHPNAAHKAELPASSTCFSCHMPKRRTEDVVHAVMTDHYIQRVKPDRDLLAPLAEVLDAPRIHTGVAVYYPPQLPPTPENEIYLAVAEVRNGAHLVSSIARLREAIGKFASSEPDIYFELGEGYAAAGKEADAIRSYQEALHRRSSFRPAIKQLAATLIAQGQFAQAIDVLRPASVLSPADDALFSDLGNAYLRQGQFGPALQALRRALELNPEQAEAQNLLGLMAIQKGDAAGAEARLRDAIRRRPDYAEAHNNLANLLGEKGNYPEAEYHFRRAVAIDPTLAEAHRGYANVLALRHAYDQAVVELRRAAALQPRSAEIHNDLADLLLLQGESQAATDEYQQAIRLNSNFVEAHVSLANLYAQEGKLADAQREFLTSLQLKPDSYEAHLGLGLILMQEGRTAEARVHCQRAMASPDPAVRATAQKALVKMGR